MATAAERVQDEERLVRAVAQGDESAFIELFQRHYGHVYRLAARLVGSTDEADDIAQDVFLRLYQRPPALGPGESARPWLSRVTANLALNALRARRRHRDRLLRWFRSEWPLSRGGALSRELERGEATELAQALLNTLSERDRTVLVLRHSGLTYEEIAAVVGVKPSSVGTLLARAERRLRERFRRLFPDEGEE